MSIKSIKWSYMPILKWKQGEQHALRYITREQWSGVTPLLKLQPIDSAPDTAALKIAFPSYVGKVSDQIVKNIPPSRAICIDTEHVSPGYQRQLFLLLKICIDLQYKLGHQIIPVIPALLLESLESVNLAQKNYLKSCDDVLVSLRTDQLASTQIQSAVDAMVTFGIKKRNLHLLIDQYSLVDASHAICFANVKPYIDSGMATGCSSVTIGGGSFPINLMGYKQGVTDIPRVEWEIWRMFKQLAEYENIRFSDYAVTNPAPQPEIDPKQVNPSVAIRYATDGAWKLYKAKGFKKGPLNQYRNLCKLLTSDSIYSGDSFSYGDSQYAKAAIGKVGNGNPSSWRKDATNHHIVLTINSL